MLNSYRTLGFATRSTPTRRPDKVGASPLPPLNVGYCKAMISLSVVNGQPESANRSLARRDEVRWPTGLNRAGCLSLGVFCGFIAARELRQVLRFSSRSVMFSPRRSEGVERCAHPRTRAPARRWTLARLSAASAASSQRGSRLILRYPSLHGGEFRDVAGLRDRSVTGFFRWLPRGRYRVPSDRPGAHPPSGTCPKRHCRGMAPSISENGTEMHRITQELRRLLERQVSTTGQ